MAGGVCSWMVNDDRGYSHDLVIPFFYNIFFRP